MADFKPGELVGIRCKIQPGAFHHEKLVTIETDTDTLSGFVGSTHFKTHEEVSYLQGKVIRVTGNEVTVRLPGSFFTTASGLTSVSPGWAAENLQHATAAKSLEVYSER